MSGCNLPEPSGSHEAVDQGLRLVSVQFVAESIAANIFERHLSLALSPDPSQRSAGIHVTVAQADQPQRSAAMRQEILPPEVNSRDHERGVDLHRLGSADH